MPEENSSTTDRLDAYITEALSYFKPGRSNPEMRLTVSKETMENLVDSYRHLATGSSTMAATVSPHIAELESRIEYVKGLLDEGPQGEIPPRPKLLDAFLVNYPGPCEKNAPRETVLRYPYSSMRARMDLLTLWGPGEGAWEVSFVVLDESGHVQGMFSRGDLEQLDEQSKAGRMLCFTVEFAFRRPETQTVVISLAGQEAGRVSLRYEDSRA